MLFRSRKRGNLLTTHFAQELHRRMFGKTWKWAGSVRTKETNPGIDPARIAVELRKLFDDVAWQIREKSMPFDEIAARFHHRLTQIHPFTNGNGRHARLMTDLLLRENGVDPFDWGNADLVAPGDVRDRYISALRAADARDHSPLFKFVRSRSGKP